MPNLQVRNVPQDLHERLRDLAREKNCTMSSIVLSAIEREVKRLEFYKRMAQRPPTDPGIDAVTIIHEERERNDAKFDELVRRISRNMDYDTDR